MFGFNKDHKIIQIQFVENGSDKPFAQSSIPVEQLPDSFEVNTTLHIAEVDWQVDRAIPANKSEFKKTGKLIIYLYKAQTLTVPLSEILFSLPTINDELPRVIDASLEDVFVVHEDDWRQVELVSREFNELVEQEFVAIREIYENHRQGTAFKSIHVRKLSPAPLSDISLFLAELKKRFGVSHEYKGLAFSSAVAIVEDGFALRTSEEGVLWGKTTKDGLVSVLCEKSGAEVSTVMNELLRDYGLFYIDWSRLSSEGFQQ
jgi:hypothetical protein